MFVRWKNRTLAKKHSSLSAERSLYAVIVKNQRVEGRTKQKVVKYLAHISEQHLAEKEHQSYFWERADQAIAELELTPEQRLEIEEKLESVVKRPVVAGSAASLMYDASSMPARQHAGPIERAIGAAVGVES